MQTDLLLRQGSRKSPCISAVSSADWEFLSQSKAFPAGLEFKNGEEGQLIEEIHPKIDRKTFSIPWGIFKTLGMFWQAAHTTAI